MATNITSITIEAKTVGITQSKGELDDFAGAADGVSKSADSSTKILDKLFAQFQKQADLLGASTSQTNAYVAALKGASETEQIMAAMLGAEVDAYRSLGVAQKEAMSENKNLDNSYKQLQSSAEAYYAAQEKAQAAGNALNAAGQRAQEYSKIVDAQRELTRTTNELAAAEAKQNKIQQNRDMEMYTASVKRNSDAQKELARTEAATTAEADRMKVSGDRFIQNLTEQATRMRLTGEELKNYNISLIEAQAKQLGVSANAAPLIESLKQTGLAAHGAHSGIAGITRETIVMLHELSQGSFSRLGGSAMVMAEKFDISRMAMRGFAAAATATGLGVGALLGVIAGVATAIASVGILFVAMIKGASEQRAFNAAILETGNYAGTTGTQLEKLAHEAAGLHSSIGAAKTVVLELASSGKFTADQIGYISKAIVEFEHVTGKSGKEITKDFEDIATLAITSSTRSTNVLADHAKKLNDHWHYLTSEQYLQIESLEKLGQSQEAAALSTKFLAEEVEKRTASMSENLGTLQKAWQGVSRFAGEAWDAMLGAGKKKTAEDEVQRLVKEVNEMVGTGTAAGARGGATFDKKKMDGLMQSILAAETKVQAESLTAQNEGAKKQKDQQEIHAHDRLVSISKQYDKIGAAKIALAEFDKDLENISAADRLKNAEVFAAARFALEAKTHEKVAKVRGVGLTGVDSELKAAAEVFKQKEFYASEEIKRVKSDVKNKETATLAGLQFERDAQNERQVLIAAEMKKELDIVTKFTGKTVSEQNLAASKRSEIMIKYGHMMNESVSAENELVRQLATERRKGADESDAQHNKELDNVSKTIVSLQDQVAAYDSLSEADKKRGVSTKQMQDHITAEQIKSLRESQDTMLTLAAESEGEIKESYEREAKYFSDLAEKKQHVMELQSKFEKQQKDNNEALKLTEHEKSLSLAAAMEKAYTDAFKGMEDALVSFVKTGKLDFKSLADSIITDLIRIQVRQAMGAAGETSLGQIISAGMKGLTGGFGSFAVSNAGVAASQGLSIATLAGAFADGGDPPIGQPSLVGERGPEIFIPKQSGTIIPNHQLGGAGGEIKFTIVNQTTGRIDNVKEQRISDTERALIITEAVNATSASLYDSNSKMSKGLASTHNLQRKR